MDTARLAWRQSHANFVIKRELERRPLIEISGFVRADMPTFLVSVYKVKGAIIIAVLYIAKKGHVQALLGDTAREDDRIGCIALIRSRDLFVLAIPAGCLTELEADLQTIGLQRAG